MTLKQKIIIWMIVVFGLVAGPFFLIRGTMHLNQCMVASQWPTSTAIIRSSHMEKEETQKLKGGKSRTYDVIVTYDYTVDGFVYSGDRITFGSIDRSSESLANQWLERFSVGAEVDVYYNPETPEISTLTTNIQSGTYFDMGFGTTFLFVGGGLLWLMIRQRATNHEDEADEQVAEDPLPDAPGTRVCQTLDWIGYSRQLEEGGCYILCDYALTKVAPLDDHDLCVRFEIKLQDTEDGWPTQAEDARQDAIEGQLIRMLESSGTICRQTASLTYEGIREQVFQVRDQAQFRAVAAQWMDELDSGDGEDYEINVIEAEGWTFYQNHIMPNSQERCYIEDRRKVDLMLESGSDASMPHQIDHRFSGTNQVLKGIADKLTADGYTRVGAFNPMTESLVMRINLPLKLNAIHDSSLHCLSLTEVMGGQYQGWQADHVMSREMARFYQASLSGCRDTFNDPPRDFSMLERKGYLNIAKPDWLHEDPSDHLWHLFKEIPETFKEGKVIWGVIMMANNLLFQEGTANCPAVLLYTRKNENKITPMDLRSLASQCYRYYNEGGYQSEDPQIQALVDLLAEDTNRTFGFPVPKAIDSKFETEMGATFITRKHLPGGRIMNKLVPIVLHPEKPFTMILPEKYWSEELKAWWMDE